MHHKSNNPIYELTENDGAKELRTLLTAQRYFLATCYSDFFALHHKSSMSSCLRKKRSRYYGWSLPTTNNQQLK